MKRKFNLGLNMAKMGVQKLLFKKHLGGAGGIVAALGLCVIAIALCVVLKEQLTTFITTIVASLTTKAQGILGA